jgi:hypothetical protein
MAARRFEYGYHASYNAERMYNHWLNDCRECGAKGTVHGTIFWDNERPNYAYHLTWSCSACQKGGEKYLGEMMCRGDIEPLETEY